MSILSKEEMVNKVKEIIKDDTSDGTIAFLEDLNDTMTDLSNKAKPDSEDWKKKYEELDASWRKKYTDRFFEGTDNPPPEEDPEDEPNKEQDVEIKDLFIEKGK